MRNLIAVSFIGLMAVACTTTDAYTGQQKTSNTAKGAVIGAVAGAITGAIVNDDEEEGALVGAVAGAAIGGGIGNYMDRQEAELRRELEGAGVRVVRNGNNIDLVMPSNITFDTNQASLKSEFYRTLNGVSTILAKYNQTDIVVEGHTDSSGSDQYNLDLSVARAETVGNYLAGQGVSAQRIRALGFGEREPIADNTTESGKAQNRRVEIQIVPIQG
jgi:outer membrane protein OmpA-like peptidoglycan-associated protein